MLLRPPGVYRAEGDTQLLTDVMRSEVQREGGFARGRRVLDVGTGSGALALAAARAGATAVTAVDLSLRSVAATWLNSRLHGLPVTVHRGDLFAPVAGPRFDLVVANPPYVPAETAVLPRHRKARCWDAGPDGRVLLDRICAGVPGVLAEGGDVLLVHSAVCDTDLTLDALDRVGLVPEVLAKASVPFGPVMAARAAMLEARGLIRPGQRFEELVVLGARHA
ncbi:HemK2/MTQ2 family protein methyltransferase [Pseudonocardia nigra]|uniref:HemK2/MTQ2 family protein methyltransferase n=1 Tax=Pseudonocardia nigra TaxID=1921578 RepID=UPI001FEBF964|nr:HemK2/MTQ2 family protein methyltransferase [Pseudonocardia nigra]